MIHRVLILLFFSACATTEGMSYEYIKKSRIELVEVTDVELKQKPFLKPLIDEDTGKLKKRIPEQKLTVKPNNKIIHEYSPLIKGVGKWKPYKGKENVVVAELITSAPKVQSRKEVCYFVLDRNSKDFERFSTEASLLEYLSSLE